MTTGIVIIIITVIISYMAFNDDRMFFKWMLNPYAVRNNREYFRFITSGFVHANYTHLGVNMITFYFFGDKVETYFRDAGYGNSTVIFIVFYLTSIIISDISSYVKYKNSPNYYSCGASGGVSAVLFAFIMFDPSAWLGLYFVIPVPAFLFGLLYLGYSFYASKQQNSKINHDAHFYGAIYGIVFAILIDPGVIDNILNLF